MLMEIGLVPPRRMHAGRRRRSPLRRLGASPATAALRAGIGIGWKRCRSCLVALKTSMYREVPITPKLHGALRKAQRETVEGQEVVVGLSVHNLTRQARKIARDAKLTPRPKFYQAMRKSRKDDWKMGGIAEPTYAACWGTRRR
jgi:hypothetical protein